MWKGKAAMNMPLGLNGNLLNLPYTPLPEGAEAAARDSIRQRGFADKAILPRFRYSLKSGRDATVNAYAFAHPEHRIPLDYGSFTVYNIKNGLVDEDVVRTLSYSHALFHLIHRDDHFDFWRSAADDRGTRVRPIRVQDGIAYHELNGVLANYAPDLDPQRIVDVKQGRAQFTIFQDVRPLQLSMFALDVTRPLLQETFAAAVNSLRMSRSDTGDFIPEDTVTDLAIQLLAAKILADTGVLEQHDVRRPNVSWQYLLTVAQERFSGYFDQRLFEQYKNAVSAAYPFLQTVSYAGFVPTMLTALYLAAYSNEQRKELGGYNTPLEVTRHIWNTIPVEFLPPNQRHVADMTCGWGSFLIAAHERLERMGDMRGHGIHNYLHGNDADHLARRLAGLGLLTSTSQDSWRIDLHRARAWPWLATHRPNIIVGNPPYGGDRKAGFSADHQAIGERPKRFQQADQFLRYAIERLAPNGYLAMLMPKSFVLGEASRLARKELLEQCDVLELWELPTKLFAESHANVGTIAVFAQKKEQRQQETLAPVPVRVVQDVTLKDFMSHDPIFTVSQISSDQSRWRNIRWRSAHSINTHIFEYRTILPERTWHAIAAGCVQLNDQASIISGLKEGSKSRRERSRQYPRQERVPYLTGAKTMLQPWAIHYGTDTRVWPGEFEKPRLQHERELRGTKVLLAAAPDPSWGRRVTVAIDRKGYFPSGSFWIVVPTDDAQDRQVSHEVVAAVMNWYVSNAWVVEHIKSRWIPSHAINTIPFPRHLSAQDCTMLTESVRRIEIAANDARALPEDATSKIDAILQVAYHLDDATLDRLRQVADWDRASQLTFDLQPNTRAEWLASGVVRAVDVERGTLTVWLDEFDDLQSVPITAWMPGWMLRPGARFRAKIPREWTRATAIEPNATGWGPFHPQPNASLTTNEAVAELGQRLREAEAARSM